MEQYHVKHVNHDYNISRTLATLSLFCITVAAGFSLRFSAPDGYTNISRKLRNLKVAATCPPVPVRTGTHTTKYLSV
jgi:hypothetical protein